MTLEEFAKEAGVQIFECGKEWDNLLGWRTSRHPNINYCGYKTEKAIYKAWLISQFGEQTEKTVIKLLKQTEKVKNGKR